MSVLNLENKILYFYKGLDVEKLRSCYEEETKEINEKGYDIFWCLQEFTDDRRLKDNLKIFKWVGADFDNISWAGLGKVLKHNPKPTMAISTRSGFHCYWRIKDIEGSEEFCEDYTNFIGSTLVPLGADPNAKDVSRILRAPFFRYWQDSKGNRYEDKEIKCEIIYDDGPKWEWEQLKRLFRKPMGSIYQVGRQSNTTNSSGESFSGGARESGGENGSANSFWARCNAINVQQGIERLSGNSMVRGQKLTLKTEGKIKRLYVDGKSSNGWVDKSGRFGSTYENTSGTLVNFLKFPEYGLKNSDIAKIFKEVFNVTDT